MPFHLRVEAAFGRRVEFAVRSQQDQVPAAGQTSRSGLRQLPSQRRLQGAGPFHALLELPSAGSARGAIRQAQRRRQVRILPHRGGLAAFNLHREGPRRQRVSARGRACQSRLRQMPSARGHGHEIQNQVCPLHGLPQGRACRAVRRSPAAQQLRELSHGKDFHAFNIHARPPQKDAVPAARLPHGRALH